MYNLLTTLSPHHFITSSPYHLSTLFYLLLTSFPQEPCLERKIQEDELLSITEVPEGLDPNEWLALHSESFFIRVARLDLSSILRIQCISVSDNYLSAINGCRFVRHM